MQHIGLFVNTSKPEAIEWTERAARLLKSVGMDCCAEPEVVSRFNPSAAPLVKPLPLEDFEKFADIIVTFGGDGTILSAAKEFVDSEIPLMGVNLGKLGFLAEYSTDELETAFSALLKGEYLLEERGIIQATMLPHQEHNVLLAAAHTGELEDNDNNNASSDSPNEAHPEDHAKSAQRFYALNDFVLHKKDFARMISIRASVDGHRVADYRADGLILSTPTGSTAYSLSSGGPIIAPNSAVFSLTPISPHSLNQRPLVIPDASEVWFEPSEDSGVTSLIADGETSTPVEPGQRIVIRRSEKVVKLLRRTQSSYYDILKKKLLWSVHSGHERS
jgi:NAD+ kinase